MQFNSYINSNEQTMPGTVFTPIYQFYQLTNVDSQPRRRFACQLSVAITQFQM